MPRKYLGFAGHLIVADSCRFHIATEVGDFLVSTIGAYQQPGTPKGTWTPVGLSRLYETFVFPLAGPCECGTDCGARTVASWGELDTMGYQTAREAQEGHEAMCRKVEAGWVSA